MKGSYLMVLEVSQKQSYIFNEKRLRNNIAASNTIAYVTSSEFFTNCFSSYYEEVKNLIYAGGGHTYLYFDNKDEAEEFGKRVSFYVLKNFPGLELFIASIPYEGEDPVANIKRLGDRLEMKKSLRQASFYQSTFGIEQGGRRISLSDEKEGYIAKIPAVIANDVEVYAQKSADKHKGEDCVNVEIAPDGYKFVREHEYLGGDKGKNNFIAVIHIDGNQMGNRTQNLKKIIEEDVEIGKKFADASPARRKFEVWRYYSRKYSESIDFDFKKALEGVYIDLADALEKDKARKPEDRLYKGLKLDKKDPDEKNPMEADKKNFPLRKIIAAGDDICFVTDGRIGLECAVSFIRHLADQKNEVDGQSYKACAGVAIVHQKYPFYRAYDLAEQLCSNAKKGMVEMTRELNKSLGFEKYADGCVSAIDWHVEYGEMMGSLSDIRDRLVDLDGEKIYARPYQISDLEGQINENPYDGYRRIVKQFNHQDLKEKLVIDIAKHKQKEMRGAIKNGEDEFRRFCKMNRITSNLTLNATRAQTFDALESADLFLPLE